MLANFVGQPVPALTLPTDADFDHIRHPLRAATIPLSPAAFGTILERSRANLLELNAIRLAADAASVAALERQAENLDPQNRERLSRVIERGPLCDRVKAARGYKCQICEAKGLHPHAFMKRDGSPYAEAHHVQPVSKLIAGSLGMQNIMVLCPNHHRQAHYGSFEVVEERSTDWVLSVDSERLQIERTAVT
jgi:predicted HNH restriction endonuclease